MRAQFLAARPRSALPARPGIRISKNPQTGSTPAQVALIDQPCAAALTKLDEQLLNFGATGTVGAAIATFVHADENLIDDVLARAAQQQFDARYLEDGDHARYPGQAKCRRRAAKGPRAPPAR